MPRPSTHDILWAQQVYDEDNTIGFRLAHKKHKISGVERITIATTGGRWFIFIPKDMWPTIRDAIDKNLK